LEFGIENMDVDNVDVGVDGEGRIQTLMVWSAEPVVMSCELRRIVSIGLSCTFWRYCSAPARRHVRDDMRTAPIAYEEDVLFAVYGVELKAAYFVTLRTQEETD